MSKFKKGDKLRVLAKPMFGGGPLSKYEYPPKEGDVATLDHYDGDGNPVVMYDGCEWWIDEQCLELVDGEEKTAEMQEPAKEKPTLPEVKTLSVGCGPIHVQIEGTHQDVKGEVVISGADHSLFLSNDEAKTVCDAMCALREAGIL